MRLSWRALNLEVEQKPIHDSLHIWFSCRWRGKEITIYQLCQLCVIGFDISSVAAAAQPLHWFENWSWIADEPSSGSVTHHPLAEIGNRDGNLEFWEELVRLLRTGKKSRIDRELQGIVPSSGSVTHKPLDCPNCNGERERERAVAVFLGFQISGNLFI